MKLNLSSNAIALLKIALTTTGEVTTAADGKEVREPRKLSNAEVSDRRFFSKAVDAFLTESAETAQALLKTHEDKRQEKIKETGTDNHDDLRASKRETEKQIDEIGKKQFEFEVSDKTRDFLKKCYLGYSDLSGFEAHYDDVVAELDQAFGL